MTVPEPNATPDLEHLYQAHFNHVWRTLRRLGVTERYLEDAAHDVFIVVHRRLPDFEVGRPARPWLTGIAYRVAADHRKRAHIKRERYGQSPSLRPSGQPSVPQLLEAKERRDLVHRALEELDLPHRVVFVMYELDDIPCTVIAESLDIPVNTVYSRLRNARMRFTDAVHQHTQASEGAK